MNPSKKCTATKLSYQSLLLFFLWALAALALAAPVAGTVVHLSGPLMAKKANGTVKILAVKSEVENGDTLVTEKNTYALVRFIDNSEITLKPGSTMTIENFSFDGGKQDSDQASFKLVKGGLRSVSGLLGKRSREKFEMKTPSATIGIRGTTFVVEYVEGDEERQLAAARAFLAASTAALPAASEAGPIAPTMLAQVRTPMPPAPGSAPGRAPGLYVQVLDGMIQLSNQGGSQAFSAGQFGFVPNFKVPPVVLPANPGLKFTPPPIFQSSAPGAAGSEHQTEKSNTVDCEVR
jgi:hypothetical protein